MKFALDGKDYEFTLDNLSLDEGEVIEDYARMGMREFLQSIESGNPKIRVIRAIVFMARKRAGEDVRWADLGTVDLVALMTSMFSENTPKPAEPEPVAGEGVAAVASPDAAPVAKLRKATARKPKVAAAEPEAVAG